MQNTYQKVSVITTTFNDLENLKLIISNILNQDYPNIEHVIIDGGSKDGTVEYLGMIEKEFSLKRMKWISEKDNGIYDAINKGIELASGDIIGCCFDQFTSNHVISKIVNYISNENSDGVHGDLDYVSDGKVIRKWRQGKGNIRFGWMPGHPTLYLKKEVYEKYGVYKTDYKISADYEYMVRILKNNSTKLSYIPEVLIEMSHGGTSTNGVNAYLQSLKEGHRALVENKLWFPFFIDLCRILIVIKQFMLAKIDSYK